jgi:hypothetical protein
MSDSEFDPISKYLDSEGRVTRWPGQKYVADRERILAYLATKFDMEKEYTEREVNATLIQFHTFADWALLRRELYERGYMNRDKDGSRYWRTPNVNLY